MRVSMAFIMGMALIVGLVIFWLLVRNKVIRITPLTSASAALALGVVGIVIPILVLAGNSNPVIQIGVMISGSILFGCGAIATAILRKHDR